MTSICQNCKFWSSGPSVFAQLRAAGAVTVAGPQPGYCTLNAPVKSADGLRWPVTSAQESCGQFEAKTAS